MSVTNHSRERAHDRLSQVGIDPDTIDRIISAVSMLADRSNAHSEAMRVLRLDGQHNERWGAESNGDEVWAIIRERSLVTFMLRRSTQPATTEAFGVDKVTMVV